MTTAVESPPSSGGFLDQGDAVALDHPFERVGEVPQQVPSISNLYRARRTATSAFGERPGAIAADDLDVRMVPQPSRQGLGRAVRQHVHRTVRLHVHEHRAVGVTAAERELVDANDPEWARRGNRQGPNRAPRRRGTRGRRPRAAGRR
jgi:hypothetical protein